MLGQARKLVNLLLLIWQNLDRKLDAYRYNSAQSFAENSEAQKTIIFAEMLGIYAILAPLDRECSVGEMETREIGNEDEEGGPEPQVVVGDRSCYPRKDENSFIKFPASNSRFIWSRSSSSFDRVECE